jgi:hypothetical protein
VYEAFRADVWRLRKDSNVEIRQPALHIEREAGEIESKVSRLEQAADDGYRAGDPGRVEAQERRRTSGTWEPR